MGPEGLIGAIAGTILGKFQVQTLFAVGVIALFWWLYRDFIWSKIK